MEKEMEDDLTVLHHYNFFNQRTQVQGRESWCCRAGVGDRRKCDGLFHCLIEPASAGEIVVKISKISSIMWGTQFQ
jgi:hypothetical protein